MKWPACERPMSHLPWSHNRSPNFTLSCIHFSSSRMPSRLSDIYYRSFAPTTRVRTLRGQNQTIPTGINKPIWSANAAQYSGVWAGEKLISVTQQPNFPFIRKYQIRINAVTSFPVNTPPLVLVNIGLGLCYFDRNNRYFMLREEFVGVIKQDNEWECLWWENAVFSCWWCVSGFCHFS